MKIRSPQMDTAIRMLTDGTFSKMTGRKIPAFSLEQAAALVGNAMHETGSPNLTNVDVVERGNSGKGKGLMQYTGPRREAYDRANPGNDMKRQMQYAAEEYAGKHDPGGNSLIGYTKSLETAPRKDVTAATTHLLNNYFRPADPVVTRSPAVPLTPGLRVVTSAFVTPCRLERPLELRTTALDAFWRFERVADEVTCAIVNWCVIELVFL